MTFPANAFGARFMAQAFLSAALTVACALPGTAQETAAPATPVNADTVVATVNGTVITLGNMLVLREQLPAEYQSLPDDVLFKGIIDQLVQQTALSQSVEGAITPRDTLALENDRRAYLAGAAVDIAAAAAVTDEALKAAYDAKYAGAAPTTEYSAAHILVATEEDAIKLKTEIDGGADFAEVAKANSTDGAAANGGDLGWFGPGMMVKEFEDAVVKMKAGEVSAPIQTQFGWHLVKLNDTRTAAAPAMEAVHDELVTEVQQKAVEAKIVELTAAATIVRSDEGIDPAILRDQTLVGN